ncbi:MAG: hypothetical protein O7A71_01765 [Chloroflexi bacterium]|nr:hypothetical protein [Chloroflexota bacterium]
MTITKAWLAPDPPALQQIPAVLGVYELADTAGVVIYIGMAGGREPFGLRGRIEAHFSDQELNPVLRERAALYRWESNQQYTTQRTEMLMRYAQEHADALPEGNQAGTWEDRPTLGRLGRS